MMPRPPHLVLLRREEFKELVMCVGARKVMLSLPPSASRAQLTLLPVRCTVALFLDIVPFLTIPNRRWKPDAGE